MPEQVYGDAGEVISLTGVRPEHLSLDDDQALTDLVDKWLTAVSDLIEAHRNRSFPAEHAGISSIANRAVANLINAARHQREAPVIRVDEWTVQAVEARAMTPELLRELKTYPAKPRFNMTMAGGWAHDER